MGTRSLTVFIDDGEEIAVLYRQFDGYPEGGHGEELAVYLAGRIIVNGYTTNDQKRNNFNGMSCVAASVIARFKKHIGEFYLHKAGTRDCGEEYIYEVTGKTGEEARIRCYDVYEKKTLFEGSASECVGWIRSRHHQKGE